MNKSAEDTEKAEVFRRSATQAVRAAKEAQEKVEVLEKSAPI